MGHGELVLRRQWEHDQRRRATKNIVGTSTTFLYDGANTVQEVIGGTNTANSLSGGIDEVFQRTDSAGARSFLTDTLGSTLALADSSGTLQTQYTFEPFGNTTVSGSATTNSFAYTGRELDGTGLDFFRARFYSPVFQRFVSEDPIGFRGGINKYSYAINSPMNFIDPLGLDVTINQYAGADHNPFGHIGIGVNTDQTQGLYPKSDAAGLTGWPTPAKVIPDNPNGNRIVEDTITIHTSPEQDKIIEDYLYNAVRNPGQWGLTGRNCTRFVEEVLRRGGVRTSDALFPRDLIHDLHNMHDLDNAVPLF